MRKPPRIVSVLLMALILHAISLSLWYAALPSGPLRVSTEWMRSVHRYSPYVIVALLGFPVGYIRQPQYLSWAVVLAILLSVAGGIVHWTAGQLGIDVDWPTASGAATGAALSLIIHVPLALIGAVAGRMVSPLAPRPTT